METTTSSLNLTTLLAQNETMGNCVFVDTEGSYFPWQWYWAWEKFGIMVGSIIGGAIVFPLMAPIVLCLLGFTCWGVMALSAAAFCQSNIGDVPKGSCFACCQSAGAGGCPPCLMFILVILSIGGAILGGYLGYIYVC